RRKDLYAGPFVDRASDLFVYWNPEADVGEPPGEVRAKGFWWSGDHRREGVLIMKGPGIRAGKATSTPEVYDLVPTILAGAGVSIPQGLDGRVIEEAFTDEGISRIARAGRRESAGDVETASGAASGESRELSEEEQKLVEEKLRSLG